MAYAGQILENPITGERIIFRETAADTGGELLAIDLVLAPDGHVPGAHVHPAQEERFEVVSGTMKFRLGRKKIIAHSGDVVVVPALFVREYEDEVRAPFPPVPIVKATLAPLTWVAKHRGLAERYVGAGLRPAPAV